MAEKNLYLITGDEFLRKAEWDGLLNRIQTKIGGASETQVFDGTEHAMAHILSAARTLPFLTDSQILRIKQSERFKEDALDELEAYLKNPFAKTYLVFESDRNDERSRLSKLIQAHGELIRPATAERLKREVQLIRTKLGEFKKNMTSGAQKLILEMCGESPVFLASILDRLILFSGDKSEINETMVAQFNEDWSEARIFDLTDAILARDTGRALMVVDKLLEVEGDAYSMLGFIHSQVKKLWQAKVLSLEGSSSSQIAARLGLRPSYGTTQFFKGLDSFGIDRLEQAIDDLHALDCKSKTGRAEISSAMRIWLVKLTSAENTKRKLQLSARS